MPTLGRLQGLSFLHSADQPAEWEAEENNRNGTVRERSIQQDSPLCGVPEYASSQRLTRVSCCVSRRETAWIIKTKKTL